MFKISCYAIISPRCALCCVRISLTIRLKSKIITNLVGRFSVEVKTVTWKLQWYFEVKKTKYRPQKADDRLQTCPHKILSPEAKKSIIPHFVHSLLCFWGSEVKLIKVTNKMHHGCRMYTNVIFNPGGNILHANYYKQSESKLIK